MAPENDATATATPTRSKRASRSTAPSGKSAKKTSRPDRSAAKATATKRPASRTKPKTATVNLPFVTAEFRAPDVHLPKSLPRPSLESVPLVGRIPRPHVPEAAGRQLTGAAQVIGDHMPERSQLALFAGLGTVAVAGLIDWPVAAAVAAGTVVARRARRASPPQSTSSATATKAS